MFYKKIINHQKKSLHLLKLKSLSEKVYCKLQKKKKNMSYMLIDLTKIHTLIFKVLKSIYIFESTNRYL